MSERPALALSGSNVTGDAPFSCALRLADRIVDLRSPAGERGDLAALARDLCRQHGVSPQDLGELRVDLGPGSYTGLRVAVTFVRFLHRFGDVPVLATDSLSLLATAALGRDLAGRRLRPLLDARRERFHCAALRFDAGLHPIEPPQALARAELLGRLAASDVCIVPAALAAPLGAALKAAGAEVVVASGVVAADLFRPELALAPASSAGLEPKYLMGSYADD